MIHLMVVGQVAGEADGLLDDVAACVSDASVIRARCSTPQQVIDFVAAHGREQRLVDVLDIFDHGAEGLQQLGGKVLFEATGDKRDPLRGAEIAAALAPHLRETAHVRLLGCSVAGGSETGASAAGRLLLWQLAEAFGERRVVFGTIEPMKLDDFDERGFRRDQERTFLFSSLGALDAETPSPNCRNDHLVALVVD